MNERRRILMSSKKKDVDYSRQYFTLKALQDCTFEHMYSDVDYSVDNGNTWKKLSADSSTPTIRAGKKVMFRSNASSSGDGTGIFAGTNYFEAEGNVMSLLYGDNFVDQKDLTGKDNAFYELFSGADYLQSAENLSLPATTLAEGCYSHMFCDCTSLTTAPALPATTLARDCYDNMFYDCTSLTTAPALPATTLETSCYSGMFSYCTSLTTAPILPATTLETSCYQNMFSGCTSLTTAPQLPATTLKSYCYSGMFYDCTSLTTAPQLPATTLKRDCYRSMFSGCTSLDYIKAMFTNTPGNSYTYNWVKGVASSGTFVKNSAASWTTTGVNGIPSGWTIQTADS